MHSYDSLGGGGAAGLAVDHCAIASWAGQVVLVGCTFAFFLHLCGGIRHLVWDTVHGFELRSIYLSGWIVVAASVALTIAAWVARAFMAGMLTARAVLRVMLSDAEYEEAQLVDYVKGVGYR